jgi:hypothetical protein
VSALAIPQASSRIYSPQHVDRLARLVFWRARRAELLERMRKTGAQPLSKPTDPQIFGARVDALRMLDKMIAELEAEVARG